MDKLMDNPWFIKIIALLLAFLLYSSVPSTSNKANDINVPGDQSTGTITDMPLKAYYDTKNLVITGLPSTVSVTLKGPTSHLQQAKLLKNFEVYADLTKAKVGTQRVKLQIRNLSDKLQATLNPAFVNVSVQEKITKEFKVGTEYNSNLIQEGYTAGQPVVEPNRVKITGAKDVIDRITYVKATLDTKQPITETFTQDARIRVLDRELNKLDVVVQPETVRVTIPVKNTRKTVPINIVQKGTPPAGVSIDSIDLDTKEATITGSEDVLKDSDHVRVEVDVSKITDDTTLTLPVIIPNGITKVSPQLVKATVKVKKSGQKTVSSLPIKTEGLSAQYKAEFKDPANQSVNLTVTGSSDSINTVAAADFNVYVNLANMTEGDYNVKIHVDGPPNVNWQLDKQTAQITILKSNA
ncbi:CdaR family protein [Neobacillus sp. SM06]|uniref:CdaR family protein n=1 Tax=Neobacillus sp. SM06 TaxID=3422492 RepID=UPI003D26A207